MSIFQELLDNTKGLPAEFQANLRSSAETLQIVVGLSQVDLDNEVTYVRAHLPELRAERAADLRQAADRARNRAEKERLLADAARLEKSAEKLRAPAADETFRNRATLIEMSARLSAQLRGLATNAPSIDPERLEKFQHALHAVAGSLPEEVGTKSEREAMARMAFVAELRSAGGNVDQAVDNFYKAAFEDVERGHHGTVGLDAVGSVRVEDYVARKIEREEQQEREALAAQNQVLQNLPKIAAEKLNPKEYAAYRLMIDNEHLLDWKIGNDGKMQFRAKTLDASDPENTIAKIVQRELDYQNIRGANMLVETTVDKLNGLMREAGEKEVSLSDAGQTRMRQSTREIVSDPAARARKPKGVGLE